MKHLIATATIALATMASVVTAQAPLRPVIHIGNTYRTVPNVTYLTVGTVESKLDVYQSRAATTPNPTLIWIHGGNWVGGSKEASLLSLLPFFEMGWNVVNVDYRLLKVAPAPAAAEDYAVRSAGSTTTRRSTTSIRAGS